MSSLAKPLSLLALSLTIVPPLVSLLGGLSAGADAAANPYLSDGVMKGLMLAGALLWFAAAPKWLREED